MSNSGDVFAYQGMCRPHRVVETVFHDVGRRLRTNDNWLSGGPHRVVVSGGVEFRACIVHGTICSTVDCFGRVDRCIWSTALTHEDFVYA